VGKEVKGILQYKNVEGWAGDRATVIPDVQMRREVAGELLELFDGAVEEALELMLVGVGS
jgi:hypothetical protein